MDDLTTYNDFLNEARTTKIKIADLNLGDHAEDGKEIKIRSTETGDALIVLTSQERVDDWIESFQKRFGKTGTIEINFKLPWFDHFKIVGNKKFDTWRNDYVANKMATLKSWGTTN